MACINREGNIFHKFTYIRNESILKYFDYMNRNLSSVNFTGTPSRKHRLITKAYKTSIAIILPYGFFYIKIFFFIEKSDKHNNILYQCTK